MSLIFLFIFQSYTKVFLKLTPKTKKDVAGEMYEYSHEKVVEAELKNEYLKTEAGKALDGSEAAKSQMSKNKETIEDHKETMAFLRKKYLKDLL